MSDVVLRPFNRQEVMETDRSRRRYEGYRRMGKYTSLGCVIIFVLSLVLMPMFASGGNPLALLRNLLFIAVLYNVLLLIFPLASGVWAWGTYMVKSRSFIDESRVDPRWLPLLSHDRYLELKAAQGGVYLFQFDEMRGRSRW